MPLTKPPYSMLDADVAVAIATAKAEAIAAASVKLQGDVVQVVYAETLTQTTLSAVIPRDNSIPQIGEGTQVLSRAITPSAVGNILQVDVIAYASEQSNTGDAVAVALFRDGAADAVAVGLITSMGNGANNLTTGQCFIRFRVAAAALTETTFTVRAGPDGGTSIFNAAPTAANYGLKTTSSITITEIKA